MLRRRDVLTARDSKITSKDPLNAAIDWRLRLRGGSVDDWAQFTRWLEEGAANAEAYDRVVLLDHDLGEVTIPSNAVELDVDRFFQPRPGSTVRTWSVLGSVVAVAGAAALAIFLPQPWGQVAKPATEITTRPGEQRTIHLADGSLVALNGGSQIRLARARSAESELIRGEALFRVRHSADQPFVIRVGDDRIQDLGTTFNLSRDKDQIRVEVAEGAVRYRRGTSGIKLQAGQTLDVEPSGDALVGRKAPFAIGSWSAGQLVYQDVAVAEVVKDLRRNLGVSVSVAPELALQRFTGSINLRGRPEKVIAEFSSTIAARPRKTQVGWLIQ